LAHQITLIPGDGIGPEITKATTRIIEHSGVRINWEVVEAGMTVLDKYRDPLPQEVINSIDDIDELNAAKRIEQAVAKVIEKGSKVTKDINPNKFVGTAEFADAVIEEL
jgi:isocitrate/isopropylmalate dehydrogenase